MNDTQARKNYSNGYVDALFGTVLAGDQGEWYDQGHHHGLRVSQFHREGLNTRRARVLADAACRAYFHAVELTTVPSY